MARVSSQLNPPTTHPGLSPIPYQCPHIPTTHTMLESMGRRHGSGSMWCGVQVRILLTWVGPFDEALATRRPRTTTMQPRRQRDMTLLSPGDGGGIGKSFQIPPPSVSCSSIHLALFLCFPPHPLALHYWCSRCRGRGQ